MQTAYEFNQITTNNNPNKTRRNHKKVTSNANEITWNFKLFLIKDLKSKAFTFTIDSRGLICLFDKQTN